MHIYRRSGTNLNFAFSPGLSITTAFDGLNFHAGASAIIGSRQRLVLTLGMTFREAEVLDKHYQLNTIYPEDALPGQASGGIRDANDLRQLEAAGVVYAIAGKALLENRIAAKEMQSFLRNA
jgi:hypothetical protein